MSVGVFLHELKWSLLKVDLTTNIPTILRLVFCSVCSVCSVNKSDAVTDGGPGYVLSARSSISHRTWGLQKTAQQWGRIFTYLWKGGTTFRSFIFILIKAVQDGYWNGGTGGHLIVFLKHSQWRCGRLRMFWYPSSYLFYLYSLDCKYISCSNINEHLVTMQNLFA